MPLTKKASQMTTTFISNEAQIVAMTRALNECKALDSPVLRVCAYIDADILGIEWAFDAEALRRQILYRSKIKEAAFVA